MPSYRAVMNKHASKYQVILLIMYPCECYCIRTWLHKLFGVKGRSSYSVSSVPAQLYKFFFILTVHSCINFLAYSILESLCFLNSSRTNCVPISEKAGGSFLWRHSSLLYRAITCILWALHDRDIDEVSEWWTAKLVWTTQKKKKNKKKKKK